MIVKAVAGRTDENGSANLVEVTITRDERYPPPSVDVDDADTMARWARSAAEDAFFCAFGQGATTTFTTVG
jgi:hypothetical protein